MADINVNNNYTDMKTLTPFKLCVLQNFPFIEADFDAVTNYQLLCKVVEYLNNVIDNNNKQNDNITQLEQNFITLYNYVKDYFDNLDVQEEINTKLDEMAENGTLANIIKPFIKVPQLLIVNSKEDMVDKTAYYILTIDNLVYYWNGTSWVSSGMSYTAPTSSYFNRNLYKSSNTDNIDFNNLTETGYYTFLGNKGTMSNTPKDIDGSFSNNNSNLIVLVDNANETSVQINIDSKGNAFYRYNWGGWKEWKRLEEPTTYFNRNLYKSSNTDNIDFNNLTETGYYTFLGNKGTMSNTPKDIDGSFSNNNSNLIVLVDNANETSVQINIDSKGNAFYRYNWGGWKEWKRIFYTDNINNNAYKGLGNFIALGDSITVSLSYKNSTIYKEVPSWVLRMSKEMYNSKSTVYATGGITTGGTISANYYNNAISDNSDFAIVFLGINDINQSIALDTFKNNYTQIVNDLLINHKFVFCISIPLELSNSHYKEYNNTILDICNSIDKSFYVDITTTSNILVSYKNYGHLSNCGYSVLADIISIAINNVLKNDFFRYELDFE